MRKNPKTFQIYISKPLKQASIEFNSAFLPNDHCAGLQKSKNSVSARLPIQNGFPLMARTATSLTKGRKSHQDTPPAPSADQGGMYQKRRARKQLLQLDEMQPTELSPADAVVADNDAPEPENAVSEKALPAMARRSRKPKVLSALETAEVSAGGIAASSDDQTSVVEAVSAPIPMKPRRKRTINTQPSQPQSASQAGLIDDARETEASLASEVDTGMLAIESSVAKWNATMGTISFDWPAIEQTAAAEGPNQVMAKLLLAARAEGANSRWPF